MEKRCVCKSVFYNEFPFLKIKFNIPEEEHCILKMEANPL